MSPQTLKGDRADHLRGRRGRVLERHVLGLHRRDMAARHPTPPNKSATLLLQVCSGAFPLSPLQLEMGAPREKEAPTLMGPLMRCRVLKERGCNCCCQIFARHRDAHHPDADSLWVLLVGRRQARAFGRDDGKGAAGQGPIAIIYTPTRKPRHPSQVEYPKVCPTA